MKPEIKHSLLGLGITAIVGIVGILYYKNAAANASANSDPTNALGSFPYFQSAALPSSVTGAAAGGVATDSGGASSIGTGIDLNALVDAQTALQSQQSTDALQGNWVDYLSNATDDFVASLSAAGYGTGGLFANLQELAGGGFSFNLGSSVIKSQNATGPASVVQSILPPSVPQSNGVVSIFQPATIGSSGAGNASGANAGSSDSGAGSDGGGAGGDGGGDGGGASP